MEIWPHRSVVWFFWHRVKREISKNPNFEDTLVLITLVICLSVALMLGPLMLMRPTKSQQRTAAIRLAAQGKNLRIGMEKDPRSQTNRSLMVYSLLTQEDDSAEPEKLSDWFLLKQKFTHELHFQDNWDWLGSDRPDARTQEMLAQQLCQLPPGVIAIKKNRLGVHLFWNESLLGKTPEMAVEQLYGCLKAIADQLPKSQI